MSADLFSLSLYVSLSLFFLSFQGGGGAAGNGRRTSKTEVKLRFSAATLLHEMNVERQKLR